jgi:hypothetical protein
VRRSVALWLLLVAAYAATLGLPAFGASDYAAGEARYLLAAKSIVDDGDVDVRDEYARRAYEQFYPVELDRRGNPTEGRLNEPIGTGLPLLIAPAYALAGEVGVELFLAAITALGMVLAYRLTLRVVPDPWAIGAAAAVGLSPPLLAYATAVQPEPAAGAALAGAALMAVRLDSRTSGRDAFFAFALLGLLPWLGMRFVPAGVAVGWFAARPLWRARRRTLAIGSVELALFSLALCIGINEAFYGGPTQYAANPPGESATGVSGPVEYLERSYRAVALFVDREYGLLRWAPAFLLTFSGLWWLWRSHRDRLARAVPQLREIELTADLCAVVLGVQLALAVLLAPTMFGDWFPARHLVSALALAVPLVAWGMRHSPRIGVLLAALTLAASAWLYVDVRFGAGSLVGDRPDAPFGPLTGLLPDFREGGAWPYALAGALVAALVALMVFEWRRPRTAES